MFHKVKDLFISILAQMGGNSLMIKFSQHTIPKSGLRVIGVARFIRFAVMDMMRYDIDLFRNCLYYEVLCNDPPERVTKSVGLVRAVPVKPNCAMRAHDHHAIHHNGDDQIPGEVPEHEK